MRLRLNLRQLAAMTLLLAASFVCPVRAAEQPSPKRVLLVFHPDGALPGFNTFEQSLIQSLHAALGPGVEFYREALDAMRFPEFTAARIDELRSRYANRKIDVVVFFGTIPTVILPGVPVVQVDNGLPEVVVNSAYGGNVVHVPFNIDPRKTIDVARRLQPKARKVLVISGASRGERVDAEEFRDRIAGERDLNVELIDNASIPELCAMLSRLPRDVIVLPTGYFRDPQGNSYVPRDVIARLADASAAPVYADSDTLVGVGTVGGYVVSWAKTGERAADAATQIIQGKKPSEALLNSSGSGVYIFDWRQLKRWGFSESDLPPDSVVLYRVPTAWEQYRWRIVGIALLVVAQSLLIAGLLIQRYRRRRAEESLRDMTGRLLQTQDEERRRIARDLHDGTGQQLSGIALSVGQVLADFPPGHERLRQLLQDSHVASRQALDEVRAVSYVLHPPILDGLGLIPALHWYLDGLQKRTSLSVDFSAPAEIVGISPDAERTLFRIVQESVSNVLRHSGGTALKIRLSNNTNGTALEIEDNGCGMSIEELERAEGAASLGVGIAGMRERVRQLHGIFKISSDPSGTRVFVSLPTHKEQYAANTAG